MSLNNKEFMKNHKETSSQEGELERNIRIFNEFEKDFFDECFFKNNLCWWSLVRYQVSDLYLYAKDIKKRKRNTQAKVIVHPIVCV